MRRDVRTPEVEHEELPAAPRPLGFRKDAAQQIDVKRLGIRWRKAYQTRHTYATVALMAGVPPAYIASQLGNSVKMLLDRYARWIPGGDQGNAKALLVAEMAGDADGIRPNGRCSATPEKQKAQANQ